MTTSKQQDLIPTWEGITRDRCHKCDTNSTKHMSPNELRTLPFKKAIVNFTDDNDRTTRDFGIVNLDSLTAWSGGNLNSELMPTKVIEFQEPTIPNEPHSNAYVDIIFHSNSRENLARRLFGKWT